MQNQAYGKGVVQLHILLIDDEARNRRVGEALLIRLGHTVVCMSAFNDFRCIDLVGFDVVLMDTDLKDPAGNGHDVVLLARERAPSISIVLMSADPTNRAISKELNVVFYLKQWCPSLLTELLQSVSQPN